MSSFISNELDTSEIDIVVTQEFLMGSFLCTMNEDLPIIFVSASVLIDPSLLPSWPFPHIAFSSITHDTSITDRFMITAARNFLLAPIQKLIVWYMSSYNPECWERKYNYYLPPGHAAPYIAATVIGFEYPRTNLPLVDYVGPFIPNTLDPLPSDIDLWLKSKKENSVVYISMGSILTGSQKFAEALYNGIPSNYSVLWSATNKTILKGIENELNNNRFLIKSWIPQISALNHSSISLAILHGGAGGVHQALYFGIPIIVIPLSPGDQSSNFSE
uniref:Glucuronosyltransferase n=1 Tax=Amphimedon queenslandica TaxID=400682 RepID=A0A1X7SFZ5_AMPQE